MPALTSSTVRSLMSDSLPSTPPERIPWKGLDMTGWALPTSVDTYLSWDYEPRSPRVRGLYERAKLAQWNASTDIDWTRPVPFGAPLPDDSGYAMASFAGSPLARAGRRMWDEFRWEVQGWMVSQFLHGE